MAEKNAKTERAIPKEKPIKKLKSRLFKDVPSEFPDSQKIFLSEEKVTNKKIMKTISFACFLGPIMMLGRWLDIFPTIEYKSILIFTVITVVAYVVLFLLTFCTKNLAEHPFMKYVYVLVFNCILWYLSFCPGISVSLGYLIVPLVACVYFNPRFLLLADVLSYFTMVFSLVTRYFLKNIPNYIDEDKVPNDFLVNSVNMFMTGKEWFVASFVKMSIEFFIFVLIQVILMRKETRIIYSNYVKNENIKNLQRGLVKGMATLVEFKEPSTGYHLQRVSLYVSEICKELVAQGKYTDYLDANMIHILEEASKIHDLGKIAVPDTILTKSTILTSQEFAIIKQHPQAGAQIIDRYIRPYYEDKQYMDVARDIALYHHEWWNGNGYPYGLKGNDIPLSARIMALADVLDSLLSKRPYKKAYSVDKTYEIIYSLSGSQFDPDLVLVLPNIKERVNEIAHDDIHYVVADLNEVFEIKPEDLK